MRRCEHAIRDRGGTRSGSRTVLKRACAGLRTRLLLPTKLPRADARASLTLCAGAGTTRRTRRCFSTCTQDGQIDLILRFPARTLLHLETRAWLHLLPANAHDDWANCEINGTDPSMRPLPDSARGSPFLIR